MSLIFRNLSRGIARPIRVTGTSSTGVAHSKGMKTEDSITLTVQWENLNDKTLGCAVYTSSWVAPKSDVHSQQRFFYMGTNGEINVDPRLVGTFGGSDRDVALAIQVSDSSEPLTEVCR